MTCPKVAVCSMPPRYGPPVFDPCSAIEGDPSSPIWIVALNPKTKTEQHVAGAPNPMTWADKPNERAPHFLRLKPILGEDWHSHLLRENRIAHTDLVKCGSPSFKR